MHNHWHPSDWLLILTGYANLGILLPRWSWRAQQSYDLKRCYLLQGKYFLLLHVTDSSKYGHVFPKLANIRYLFPNWTTFPNLDKGDHAMSGMDAQVHEVLSLTGGCLELGGKRACFMLATGWWEVHTYRLLIALTSFKISMGLIIHER